MNRELEDLKALQLQRELDYRTQDYLKRNIYMIKQAMTFFGLGINIDEEKKTTLDITKNNKLLTQPKVTKKFKPIYYKDELEVSFEANLDEDTILSYTGAKDYFTLTEKTGDKSKQIIVLYDEQNTMTGFVVSIQDPDSIDSFKQIGIYNDGLVTELESVIDPKTNLIQHSEIIYSKKYTSRDELLIKDEKYIPGNRDNYYEQNTYEGKDFFTLNNRRLEILKCETDSEYQETINMILSHPRNKDVITYTTKEIDKEIPNIEEFISGNFPIYDNITKTSYSNEAVDDAMDVKYYVGCPQVKPSKQYTKFKRSFQK